MKSFLRVLCVTSFVLCVPFVHAADFRLKDKTTASTLASDDWLYLDGATNGVRKFDPHKFMQWTRTAKSVPYINTSGVEEVSANLTYDYENSTFSLLQTNGSYGSTGVSFSIGRTVEAFHINASSGVTILGTVDGAPLRLAPGSALVLELSYNSGSGAQLAAITGNLTVSGTFNGHTFTPGSSTFTGTAGQTYTFPAATSTLYGSSTKTDVLQAADFAADAGASDTYTATLSPAITAYVTGGRYRFKANTANTGAASINFNALGAKTIVKLQGSITTALADNDIRSGQWVELVYDGTNMQMVSALGNVPTATAAGSTGDWQTNSSGVLAAVTPATGWATLFGAPSSANFRAWLTDESGTGLIMTDNGTLNAGTIAGATSFTGTINNASADTITITANAGVIDVTKNFGSATNSAATTLTLSTDNVAATRWVKRVLINTDASNARVFTIDTVTDILISVPASSSMTVVLKSQGASGWALDGGGSNVLDLTADTTPAITKLMETVDATTGGSKKSTVSQVVAAAVNATGTMSTQSAGDNSTKGATTAYADAAVLARKVTFVLTIDALASSMDYTIGFVPAAFTITDLYFVHNGTLSSPSVVPTIKYGTDRSSGTSVVTSPSAVTAATTPSHVTSFNNSAPSAASYLWITTASVSGTVDKFTVVVVGHY